MTISKLPEPTKTEYFGLAFVAVALVLLANSRQLLGYYGLTASDQLVQSSAHEATHHGLKLLDSVSATSSVVTFLIWAMVGMVCFAIVESMFATVRELHLESELSSNRYVHPAAFTKARFWRGLLLNGLSLFLGVLLLASSVFGFVLFIVPLGLAYCRPLLFSTSLSNAGFFVLGAAIIYVALLIIDVCIRLLLHRRTLLSS